MIRPPPITSPKRVWPSVSGSVFSITKESRLLWSYMVWKLKKLSLIVSWAISNTTMILHCEKIRMYCIRCKTYTPKLKTFHVTSNYFVPRSQRNMTGSRLICVRYLLHFWRSYKISPECWWNSVILVFRRVLMYFFEVDEMFQALETELSHLGIGVNPVD